MNTDEPLTSYIPVLYARLKECVAALCVVVGVFGCCVCMVALQVLKNILFTLPGWRDTLTLPPTPVLRYKSTPDQNFL